MSISRRTIVGVGAGIAVTAVVGAGYGGWQLLRHRYPPTPYDDLFELLPSREATAVLASHLQESGDVAVLTADSVAHDLRRRLQHGSLADLIAEDTQHSYIAQLGRWIMPISVLEIVWLAKETSGRS